ncbi:hypothetical protein BCR41DRAFT_367486 [Lobosporangium transversale]|uniref:Uncharacterized protein n=1 Tax=Lobosporangium transversale TaxID=64571 RepID=A0A1Y2H061_9FUNG|nr:hypothetical protein BCR41DRAFT_367486 [Lobosporangium transversale]ORZ27947.1 hypothetical protein BCR41DRAFT_367486 [Lobosporangium transversale]|eukprot:XP_021885650.1 hypothetical protein BCR41DRAFT_367486 [Lobosporangium transversale]
MYRKNLDGAGFEDVLFQQLIRSPGLVLQTTNLAGENPLDVDLGATGYELMQKPPRMLGRDGMGILVRCYVGYERFSFIQGYRFIQVSVRDFKTYDKESAMIELAFDKGPGAKNQIEEYLDAAFGGFHEAILIGRGIRKRFEVKKDGILRKDFKVIYICGRGDFGEGASGKHGLPNHKLKALEYPEVRHICFGELKQSDLAL